MIHSKQILKACPFINDQISLAKEGGKFGATLYMNTFSQGNKWFVDGSHFTNIKLSEVARWIEKEGFIVNYKKIMEKDSHKVIKKTLHISWRA